MPTSRDLTPDDSSRNRSRGMVHRMIRVMDALTEQSTWGVRELAAYLGFPKSGLHRTLQEMAAEGLVRVDEEGNYSVSAELLRIAHGLIRGADIVRASQPYMQEARDATTESVLLVEYNPLRQQIMAVNMYESLHPVQYVWGALRDWTDIHLSASGLAVLAFLPEKELREYFETPRVDAAGRATTLENLLPDLQKIRERGWATTHGNRVPGTTGVGSPIRNAQGAVVGAIVIVWPDREDMITPEEAGKASAEAALKTSIDLGWMPPSNEVEQKQVSLEA